MVGESRHFCYLDGCWHQYERWYTRFSGTARDLDVEKRKKKAEKSKVSGSRQREAGYVDGCQPTLTHRAIAKLASEGTLNSALLK
jgi:hypothetical protein